MKWKYGALTKVILVGIIFLGLYACASVAPEGVGHEGGIVGTGNKIDCSLPDNKHKKECLDRNP